jgi:hypothetical protein
MASGDVRVGISGNLGGKKSIITLYENFTVWSIDEGLTPTPTP